MDAKIHLSVQVTDWLHSLPSEIEVIWAADWNPVKVLYIFNRYFLVDMVFYYVCESTKTLAFDQG
jgi:hypothetical protein